MKCAEIAGAIRAAPLIAKIWHDSLQRPSNISFAPKPAAVSHPFRGPPFCDNMGVPEITTTPTQGPPEDCNNAEIIKVQNKDELRLAQMGMLYRRLLYTLILSIV